MSELVSFPASHLVRDKQEYLAEAIYREHALPRSASDKAVSFHKPLRPTALNQGHRSRHTSICPAVKCAKPAVVPVWSRGPHFHENPKALTGRANHT